MCDAKPMKKGVKLSLLNWTKQKWAGIGIQILFGKEFETKFVRVMVSFIFGVKLEIVW